MTTTATLRLTAFDIFPLALALILRYNQVSNQSQPGGGVPKAGAAAAGGRGKVIGAGITVSTAFPAMPFG